MILAPKRISYYSFSVFLLLLFKYCLSPSPSPLIFRNSNIWPTIFFANYPSHFLLLLGVVSSSPLQLWIWTQCNRRTFHLSLIKKNLLWASHEKWDLGTKRASFKIFYNSIMIIFPRMFVRHFPAILRELLRLINLNKTSSKDFSRYE